MIPKPNLLSPGIPNCYGTSSPTAFHTTLNIFRAVLSGLLLMKSRCLRCCGSSNFTQTEECQLKFSIRDLSPRPSQICGPGWPALCFLKTTQSYIHPVRHASL